MASKCGPMVLNTKVNGKTTRLTAMANSSMLTETYTKDNGKMIKHMAREATLTLTVLPMSENGKMISNMVRVWRHGLMEQSMRASTLKERSMARGH